LKPFAGGDNHNAFCEDRLSAEMAKGEVDVGVVGDVEIGAFL
jgi:hypothetical protein